MEDGLLCIEVVGLTIILDKYSSVALLLISNHYV